MSYGFRVALPSALGKGFRYRQNQQMLRMGHESNVVQAGFIGGPAGAGSKGRESCQCAMCWARHRARIEIFASALAGIIEGGQALGVGRFEIG